MKKVDYACRGLYEETQGPGFNSRHLHHYLRDCVQSHRKIKWVAHYGILLIMYSANIKTSSQSSQKGVPFFFYFWSIILFAILDNSFNQLLSNDSLSFLKLTDKYQFLHSEYALTEQLSKYCLFLLILISVHLYQTAKNIFKIEVSLLFFFLGLIMYLAESNMIHSVAQPFYGAVIFPWLCILLIKDHKKLTALIVIGVISIMSGIVDDYLSEFNWLYNNFLMGISKVLGLIGEEEFDLVGQGFFLLAAIYYAFDPLKSFISKNKKGIVPFLGFSAMITIANGFLHYGYKPNAKLEILALILVIGGFVGLVWTNERIFKENKFFLLNTDCFYLFIIFFFIILPTVYHANNQIMESFVLWFPTLTLFGIYLFNQKKKELL